jgi:hypothetical protein
MNQWIGSYAMFEDAGRSLSGMNSEIVGTVFCMTLEVMREAIESCGIYYIRPVAIHRHSREYYEAVIEFLPEDMDDNPSFGVIIKNGKIYLKYVGSPWDICSVENPDFNKIRVWTEDYCNKVLKGSGRLWRWSYDASC